MRDWVGAYGGAWFAGAGLSGNCQSGKLWQLATIERAAGGALKDRGIETDENWHREGALRVLRGAVCSTQSLSRPGQQHAFGIHQPGSHPVVSSGLRDGWRNNRCGGSQAVKIGRFHWGWIIPR
jgi:hypothetical protein